VPKGIYPRKRKTPGGQRFGRLITMEYIGGRRALYRCRCDCGNILEVQGSHLRSGSTRSCGCIAVDDLIGRQFGRLIVLSRFDSYRGKKILWNCACDCSNTVVVIGSDLKSGHTKSCGCLRSESPARLFRKHGHACDYKLTPEYSTWRAVLQRVLNHNGKNPSYADIDVCDRWNPAKGGSFENFFADLGPRPKGTSLGRYADLSNYAPGECCWMTRAEQGLARRNRYALLKWAARQPQQHQAQIAA
jgi:hypothetical protein